jgi:hypothetical protein
MTTNDHESFLIWTHSLEKYGILAVRASKKARTIMPHVAKTMVVTVACLSVVILSGNICLAPLVIEWNV